LPDILLTENSLQLEIEPQ